MEPIRNFLRHKKRSVQFFEAEATKIDYEKKVVYINDGSEIKGDVRATEVPFDMLVVGVGAENATFGMSPQYSSLAHNGQHADRMTQASQVSANTASSSRKSAMPR